MCWTWKQKNVKSFNIINNALFALISYIHIEYKAELVTRSRALFNKLKVSLTQFFEVLYGELENTDNYTQPLTTVQRFVELETM